MPILPHKSPLAQKTNHDWRLRWNPDGFQVKRDQPSLLAEHNTCAAGVASFPFFCPFISDYLYLLTIELTGHTAHGHLSTTGQCSLSFSDTTNLEVLGQFPCGPVSKFLTALLFGSWTSWLRYCHSTKLRDEESLKKTTSSKFLQLAQYFASAFNSSVTIKFTITQLVTSKFLGIMT